MQKNWQYPTNTSNEFWYQMEDEEEFSIGDLINFAVNAFSSDVKMNEVSFKFVEFVHAPDAIGHYLVIFRFGGTHYGVKDIPLVTLQCD